MENLSGLRPLGHAVLIEPTEPEKMSTLIAIPDSAKDRMQMAEQHAVVIEVGSEAWVDETGPRAKPGDRVLVTKYAGFMAQGPLDGKTYRLVNDRDLFCALTPKESSNV